MSFTCHAANTLGDLNSTTTFGPYPDEITTWITSTCPETIVAQALGATSFGVEKATFEQLTAANPDPDYAALDRMIPHPVYARRHWAAILNPGRRTFDETDKPLIAEAYQRLAGPLRTARRARAG